ncbi:DUF5000 domain-containing lipoprotein [Proteiniphilum sp.]|uniref:DUF5000 domain-containing lipoprotein n=1 Tax=Proteiniphilum sp. TaxID=1926877 RepID=UPI002B2012E6|nr:DUF5000 domain-containing lipoprotein [Proteiniphilum sp.]MEA4916714.1 DUF5000 domain-containing lipoprotein [Proteiniphilum sp.]
MKKYNFINFIFILTIILFSCKEEPIGQIPIDNTPPGKVTDLSVKNIKGGAIITYVLPKDEDLLYVKAQYMLKDSIPNEVKSSLYTDTLKIYGFGDTKPRQVTLYAVDRSRNESEGVSVTVEPLEPPVLTIAKTLRMIEDFGGIHLYWENEDRAEISVVVLREDSNMEYVPIETFYSSVIDANGAVRGLDTIPMNFGIFVQDRWENRSEILYNTLTPLFETKLDRLKFRAVTLPNDEPSAWGWVLQNVFDGIIGDQGFHTAQGSGRWPHAFTIDLGVSCKISRIKMYQRQGDWIYRHGNIKKFQLWGSNTLDVSGNWDSWIKLMDCESIKPSGLPLGQYSAEDQAWAADGEEFINSPENPTVRYIRFLVTDNWSGGDFVHISEIEVFGDNRF